MLKHRLFLYLPLVPSVLIAFMGAGPNGNDDVEPALDALNYDCGTLALYSLFRIERVDIELRELESALPPPSTSGHTMRQLRDAARSRGLNLIGVRLTNSERAPNTPALVYVKNSRHGHFLVIRPVGHTGKLVQVIDSTREPEVIDADELYASPDWTGVALIPSRPNWPANIVTVFCAIATSAFLLYITVSRVRRRRDCSGSTTAAPIVS